MCIRDRNASTSTVRLAGSSGANPFACIASGIACLWGPAHGGANEACIRMLEEINSVNNIPEYVKKAKKISENERLDNFMNSIFFPIILPSFYFEESLLGQQQQMHMFHCLMHK